MAATQAISSRGTELQRGGGTGTAPVAANVTIGASNAQVKYTAKAAGTEGNSVTVAQVVSGNSTPLSVSVAGYAITVNVATNGSAAALSTANEVIAAVNASADAARLVTASVGTGTGVTVVSSAAATALTGGIFGTEVFTAIAEVGNIDLTGEVADEVDVSNLGSLNARKEFIGGQIDPGSLNFEINFVPQSATHDLLRNDVGANVNRSWRVRFPDSPSSGYQFSGYVKSFAISAQTSSAIKASVSLRISGSLTSIR